MAAPLMPKATAVWLVENTSLTFEQIAEFCGLHPLEVQAIADGEVAMQMQGLDPVANGQTTKEEIERCQRDPEARLKLAPQAIPPQLVRHKGPRYTPISKRQDKPDAIMYLLRNHPELSDAQISKLIGTTKPTIAAVRDRTHWNSANIKPRHPVGLGLCTLQELDDAVARALRGKRPAGDKEIGRQRGERAGRDVGDYPLRLRGEGGPVRRAETVRDLAAASSPGSLALATLSRRCGRGLIPSPDTRPAPAPRRSRRGSPGRRSSPACGSPRRRRCGASCRAGSCRSGSSAGARRPARS